MDKKQMKELEKLKIAPKEDEENLLLLTRAEGLYAQLTGDAKETLEEQIKAFNTILSRGSMVKIKKAAKGLRAYLDLLEMTYLAKTDMRDELDEFEKWFDELEQSDDEEEIEDWGKLYYTS